MSIAWLALLVLSTALVLFAFTRAPHERRLLLPGAAVNLLFAVSQVAMPYSRALSWTLMAAVLVITVIGLIRLSAAQRRAAFTTLRAPFVMGAGAIVCIVIAEILPNDSRWMLAVLALIMILAGGGLVIGTYRVTKALFAPRARQRADA